MTYPRFIEQDSTQADDPAYRAWTRPRGETETADEGAIDATQVDESGEIRSDLPAPASQAADEELLNHGSRHEDGIGAEPDDDNADEEDVASENTGPENAVADDVAVEDVAAEDAATEDAVAEDAVPDVAATDDVATEDVAPKNAVVEDASAEAAEERSEDSAEADATEFDAPERMTARDGSTTPLPAEAVVVGEVVDEDNCASPVAPERTVNGEQAIDGQIIDQVSTPVHGMRPGDAPAAAVSESIADREDLTERWEQALLNFIDDPQGSTIAARSIATDALEAHITALRALQAEIDAWQKSDSPDTEVLRTAVRGYRDLVASFSPA